MRKEMISLHPIVIKKDVLYNMFRRDLKESHIYMLYLKNIVK